MRHEPDERHPVRLVGNACFEVWIIGWTTGQSVGLHDHGGSAAAIAVTEGELTEVGLGGRDRRLPRGTVLRLGRHTIHDVVNRRDTPATSVHVYSPPLTTMTYYDLRTGQPVETTVFEPETPLLTDWPIEEDSRVSTHIEQYRVLPTT